MEIKAPPDYFEGRRQEIGWVFKKYRSMTRYYWGPLAAMFGAYHILLLTTIGRKSGLPRKTALTFTEMDGSYAVAAGLGERSDWYQNLLVHNAVEVQVGLKRFAARAEPVTDPVGRRDLAEKFLPTYKRYGMPGFLNVLMRRNFGFDFEDEVRQALAHAEEMPVVILRPVSSPRQLQP